MLLLDDSTILYLQKNILAFAKIKLEPPELKELKSIKINNKEYHISQFFHFGTLKLMCIVNNGLWVFYNVSDLSAVPFDPSSDKLEVLNYMDILQFENVVVIGLKIYEVIY